MTASTTKTFPSGHVFIAVSIDGYIARRNGDIDWLSRYSNSGEDHGYHAFMASVDGIVMGRNTFEKALTFQEWPYEKPVVVVSRSLGPHDVPPGLMDKVRISPQRPDELMADLLREGWRHAYIDGGQLIQSFIKENLLSDLVLTRVPILLGDGIPLFGQLLKEVDLKHIATTSFPSGLVQSRYEFLSH
jgi:dihydrofolate reductase